MRVRSIEEDPWRRGHSGASAITRMVVQRLLQQQKHRLDEKIDSSRKRAGTCLECILPSYNIQHLSLNASGKS